MRITKVPGDGDSYEVPAKLVNWLVYSILGALVSIGAYMVAWNRSDNEWKTGLMIRMENVQEKLGALQQKIDTGILPRTEERINALSDRLQSIEREQSQIYSTPDRRKP